MKYNLVRNEFTNNYAEVIDTLTHGHRLRHIDTITELEFESLLTQVFEVESNINPVDCFNGRYADVLPIDGDIFKNLGKSLRNIIKQEIEQNTTAQVKKIYLRKLKHPKKLKKLIVERNIPKDYAKIISNTYPIKLSEGEVTDIIVKSDEEINLIKQKIYDSILSFNNLLKIYRFIFPNIDNLSDIFIDFVNALQNFVNLIQTTWKDKGHEINDNEIIKFIINYGFESYHGLILKLSDKYNLDHNYAIDVINEMVYEYIKSIKNFILIFMEYYKKQKTSSDNIRAFRQSDLLDITHLRYMPYVDFLLTDKDFKNMCMKIGP